ncbi:permease of the drug/metabolite transporter DMT superfamily [Piscinibacter sakaiensis]|uniref:Permease of the drug/metabolite transporter DMT superfamily n=1 Tax=Piscinibacter sakaiensis TaxID=1547922 RepID=A0A0K8P5U5_PISS1|nr:permease of the drug/metabolite transporter DMT superfamily [Piscinibacter sakaiensis]
MLLALLTLVWGLNWPVMKLGVSTYPPLSFRALSMWLGLPVLWAALRWQRLPLAVPRAHWPALARLTLTNMLVWHVAMILALPTLSSGRAAILGYTMPVFAALWGLALYGERLRGRQAWGVAAAGLGVTLLLWHELGRMAGSPAGVGGMLLAAVVWALGTQQLRRTTLPEPTLTLVWWMSVATTLAMSALAWALERGRWGPVPPAAVGAIVYNAVLIFGFAQPAWLLLARALPPMASSLSVMMIPVLGVVSGALWLGERLHWQDAAALLLMGVAIGSVLWPARAAAAQRGA